MAALATSCLMALFFSLLSSSSIVQSYNNITLSDSLTAVDGSSPWLSPLGDFAFGFRLIDGKDAFLLAIWFNKIPDRTIVWCANGDSPAQEGSKIQLTDSGFVLTDPQSQEIWRPNLIGTTGISYAAMLDSGNLVIVSSNSAGYAWESFKNPTDTLLPTQTLEKKYGILSGRLRATNYANGKFELRMLGDGNLVLNTKGWPTNVRYKAYNISDTFGEGMRLVFNESGYLYIEKSKGDRFILKPPSTDRSITEYYYRVTLEFDGVLAQYAHPRSSSNGVQRWSTVWSIPDDICTEIFNILEILGSGVCGFNSYCELTTDRRPKCGCPPGYLPIKPEDQFSGCRPKFIQGCGEEDESRDPSDVFYFERVKGLDWPTGDYEKLEFSTQQECEKSCLNDCFCALAVYRSNCVKKKLPFSNGRFQYLDNVTALIKLRRVASPENSSPSNSGTRKKDRGRLISPPLFGSSVAANVLLLAATSVIAFLIFRKRVRKSKQGSSGSKTNLRVFTYEELEEATDGFKEELGRGSFGIVYKGFLALGVGNSVAVKKLDRLVEEGEKEFKAEVTAIGRTHHKNLVQLLGFCEEGQHRLLVYEFMSNGTLASLLFGISKPDWSKRIQFAVDIARGLTYLHEECSLQVIHCDIKPQNILLDDNFIARISDFGLAKLLMSNQTRTLTGIRGTRGYVAPEWFRNKPVTAKVDVYSYGVMLLEIICCRKSTLEFGLGGEEKAILTDWSYNCYCEGMLEKLVEDYQDALKDMGRVQRWVMIAIWCIQEDPSLRPTMKMVTQMLEGVVDVSLPPSPSFTQSL